MIKRLTGLFLCGSLGYTALELLWRGRTHWSMSLTGGIIFTEMAWLRQLLYREPLTQRCLSGAALITTAELVVGMVINRLYHLDVWDYSQEHLNFKGQICAKYCILWYVLSAPAMELAGRISGPLLDSGEF